MTFAASLSDIVGAWPISFCVGVIVGIVLASRGYRIVRVPREKTNGEEV